MGYDNIISFFDSEEIKKEKELLEKAEKNSSVETREDLIMGTDVCEDEISISELHDSIPSIFDSKELYCNKLNFIRSFTEEEYLEVDDVKLLPGEVVVSDMKPRETVMLPAVVVAVADDYSVGNFHYSNGKLVFKDGTDSITVIGNFWINIKKEIVHVEELVNEQNTVIGCEERVTWEVEITAMGQQFQANVSMKSLMNDTEILKYTRDRGFMEMTKESRQLYRYFISEIIAEKKYETVWEYGSTGWTKDKNHRWMYLTDIGVIGYPELPIRANVPYHFSYDSNKVGSKEIFNDVMALRSLCKEKPENSVFLLHYMVMSMLATIFQECGHAINFVTALIGATNSQKTSTAIIFTRLFDRTPKAVADIRFNSTEVAIMEKMETYGDAILLVDDFLPYEDKRLLSEQLKKSETIIRSYGDRVPRKRSKMYAKMNAVPEFSRVKGCCIITGEIFDTNSESSATRVLELEFAPGDVDLNLLTYFQSNLLNVPSFAYDFISYVSENIEYVNKVIMEEIGKVRAGIYNVTVTIPRFRDTIGIFAAETRLFYSYAVQKGFISKEDAANYRNIDLTLVEKVVEQNEMGSKIKSPSTFILIALKKAIEKGEIHKVSMEESYSMQNFDDVYVDTEGYIYILPDILWKVYRQNCKEMKRDLIYKNGRELASPLKKDNVLLIKDEGESIRATHKIKSHTQKRFFFISKKKFNEICLNFQQF